MRGIWASSVSVGRYSVLSQVPREEAAAVRYGVRLWGTAGVWGVRFSLEAAVSQVLLAMGRWGWAGLSIPRAANVAEAPGSRSVPR